MAHASLDMQAAHISGAEKSLIVAPAWVGDMVMAHALIQLLHQASPATEIHVAAPAATAAIAQRMVEVSNVHQVDFRHGQLGWGKRRTLGHSLRKQQYRTAYILPNSWKSALLPWFAQVKRRVGWSGEARYGLLNDRRVLNKVALPLMIERFMALAHDAGQLPHEPYPQPKLQADQANAQKLLAKFELQPSQVAVLCPGAEFGAAKKWPVQHYADLAQQLSEQGWRVWLLGSPADRADCDAITQLAPATHNLAGKTSLLDAIDLISLATQAVCNDSGLMHIACALGVPTVGIFGSTTPNFTPPLGDQAKVAQLDMSCRPCFQRECPLGHLNCLNTLEPQVVMDYIIRG